MYDISIENKFNELDLNDVEESNIVDYLLCLPKIKDAHVVDRMLKYQYYVIDSNWREMSKCGKLVDSKCP